MLNKVQTGEADAGLVYVTDVKGAGDKVKGVTFPESQEAVNKYPIAALTASKNQELAIAVHRAGDRTRRAESARRCRLRPALTTPDATPKGAGLDGPRGVLRVAGVGVRTRGARCGSSSCCRWGLWPPGSGWSDFFALITSESSVAALQLSLKTSSASHRAVCGVGGADGLGAGPHRISGATGRPVADAAAAGAAAGGRWDCLAVHVRPPRPAWPHPRGARHPDRLLHRGGGLGPDLCRPTLHRRQPGRHPTSGRPAVRGGRRDPGGPADHSAAAG